MADEKAKIVTDATGPSSGPAPAQPEVDAQVSKQEQSAPEAPTPDKAEAPAQEAPAHATPTQARRVHTYYIAGIKQPEIARREGIHSSKVSVAIHRGLRNMRRCYDVLFQTE